MSQLDVVIPCFNEAENIETLTDRLTAALNAVKIKYTLIFVDDNSTDKTSEEIARVSQKYAGEDIFSEIKNHKNGTEIEVLFNSPNIKLIKKVGPPGKATAILQGIRAGSSPYICMIDADLQYPPEKIPEMFEMAKKAGIVVAKRKMQKINPLRRLGSAVDSIIFQKLLLGLSVDAQSGLKVFKREIIENLDTSEVTSWTLDVPLILTAGDMGYRAASFDVEFANRKKGKSKINFLKTGFEIAKSSLKLKFRPKRIYEIKPENSHNALGAGIAHQGKRYVTHSRLNPKISALFTFTTAQKMIFLILFLILLGGIVLNAKLTAIILITTLSVAYFADLCFAVFIIQRSLNNSPEIKVTKREIAQIDEKSLPIYSVLVPLYREAEVLPNFIASMKKLDYPKEKLDVILLLEEDDKETIREAKNLNLPKWIRALVVPHSYPKTKPKACNYGLNFVKGDYTVIYDAEDSPEPLQLKKAFLAFAKAKRKVVCLQSKLNYYNANQNLLTKLFTTEYSLWFDMILPGLQSLDTTIPLGGTSNHFRTSALRYLDGWDPFNVTEDCDLGTRLFKNSFRTAIIDSTTYEEANSIFKGWIRQRSRWIKGYLQTYLVHMRDPLSFYRKYGIHALIFQMITGLRMTFTLINPLLWLTTIAYFAARPIVGPTIEALYPMHIFYIATFSAVFGNFFYLYLYMIAAVKRHQWSLVKYVYLIPVYWIMASVAAAIAFYQLVTRPFYWEKTKHGLSLPKSKTPPSGVEKLEEPEEDIIPEPITKPAYVPAYNYSGKPGLFGIVNKLITKNPLLTQGGILVFALGIANVLNFLFNAYLGRVIDIAEFGTISLINNIYSLTAVITGAIASTISYKTAFNLGKYGSVVKAFWKKQRSRIFLLSTFLTLGWILSSQSLQGFFNSESILPFLLFAPFLALSFVAAVDTGFLSGSLKFGAIALLTVLIPLFKLILSVIFVKSGLISGIYLAIPLSTVIPFLIGWIIAVNIKEVHPKEDTDENALDFPFSFLGSSILSKFSTVIFLSSDVILAKHFLPPAEAGQYALLSLSGKIIYFLGSLFSQFINPIASKAEGAKEDSRSSFNTLFALTTLSTIAGFLFIGSFGKYTIPLMFGNKAATIVSILPIYSIGIVCFTLASTFVNFHQVKKHYLFPVIGFLIAGAEVLSISKFHSGSRQVSEIVSLTGFAYLLIVSVLNSIYPVIEAFGKRIRKDTRLFGRTIPEPAFVKNGALRILIFNWRDTKHVWAGGAEVYLHQIARRLVDAGHSVTLFCGTDRKNPSQEVIDGVQIIRRGGFYTVYLWAFIYYITKLRGRYDVVIDSENGIPFFTPLYVRVPVIGLVHHVHAEIFIKGLKLPFYLLPLAYLAKQLEGIAMPYVYRNIQMVTVSESTRKDMTKLGLGKKQPISIISPGVDLNILKTGIKTGYPLVSYVGRLQAYKSIDTLIEAFSLVVRKHPNAILKIAGFGEAREFLEKLVKRLKLSESVEFLGKVTDEARNELLRSSWVFVNPSIMEGFGISVIEASASGTPVVASNVPGLRDSVKNPSSGFLVEQGNPKAFAEKINLIIEDKSLREEFEKGAVLWAKNFAWDKSADKFVHIARLELSRKLTIPNLLNLAVERT